jgi:Sap, sulfolipid-1-addressing protein
MGQGISEVLAFGVGVAISPAAIIAVILMLFSRRAGVNGPLFLLGWVVALGGLVAVVYAISDQSNAATSNTSSDSVSWLKIALGASFLLLARREWRKRPAPGAESEMPKWMARVDALTPTQSLGLGVLLGGLNPKNLALGVGAAAGVAQLGVSTADAVVSLIVFVAVGSLPRRVLPAGRREGEDRARRVERLTRGFRPTRPSPTSRNRRFRLA